MITLVKPLSVEAASSADYVTLKKDAFYNKDGKYYTPFTITAINPDYDIFSSAKLVNSSGKQIYSWDAKIVLAGKSLKRELSMSFKDLPSGTYTLKFTLETYNEATAMWYSGHKWTWDYDIKHTAPEASFSYKSYETYYDSDGRYMHKINIQCTNMKGEKLNCKIYDEYGYLVCSWNSSDLVARKTNNEVGYFCWSGYTNGEKQPSGNYTFVITATNSKKVVEKTLNLKILEKPKG